MYSWTPRIKTSLNRQSLALRRVSRNFKRQSQLKHGLCDCFWASMDPLEDNIWWLSGVQKNRIWFYRALSKSSMHLFFAFQRMHWLLFWSFKISFILFISRTDADKIMWCFSIRLKQKSHFLQNYRYEKMAASRRCFLLVYRIVVLNFNLFSLPLLRPKRKFSKKPSETPQRRHWSKSRRCSHLYWP